MANAARIDDIMPPLIEEQVDTGLRELLDNYRPSYSPGGAIADELDERFVLRASEPLAQFNHSFAKAYAATDKTATSRPVYAMVCEPEFPHRLQAVTDASGFSHPHLSQPLGFGTVRCSHLNESRFVIFFERPQGTPLSALVASQTRLHESKVISSVLGPACKALIALREHKVHHGNIRPEGFFIGESSILGECYSAPAGTIAHFLYEPSERLMADPLGRGDANEKADVYALGVLAFEMMFGLEKLKTIPREEIISRTLSKGSYQLFANNRDFPAGIQDFFRGTLTDNITERWSLDQVAQFIGGKRFNMIAPTAPKDAARPFAFMNENIMSRRQLAHMLHRNWREATKDIAALNLDRWCETSLHRPELVEHMERALRIGSERNATERQISDMMTRVLAILDPYGPLRARTLSVRPDGMGLMLVTLADTQEPELNQLMGMIDTDVSTFWSEQLPIKTPEVSQAIFRLQRIKPYLNMKSRSLGFGIERALYELNPSLSCQSPLVKSYHVTTVPELLSTLDVLAKSRSGDTTMIDRHIAGFIGAKIDLRKPIRLSDLTSITSLHNDQELLMLNILAKAQQKHAGLKLVGLAAWSGMHVEKMLGEVHNRVIRKQQKLKLKRRAAAGSLKDVLACVLNRDVGDRDNDGFIHAMALHEINYKRVQFLKHPLILEYKSRKLGGQMALTVSYVVLTFMLMRVVSQVFGV
jgi:hypothetical protein